MVMLSPHFSLQELTVSETATRRGISNEPTGAGVEKLRVLCVTVLEPIRTLMGAVVRVLSGYRSPDINQLIGGSKSSQHVKCEASDISSNKYTTRELYELIKHSEIPYDQLICEHPDSPSGGWVHVSYSPTGHPRRECLIAKKNAQGETYYVHD